MSALTPRYAKRIASVSYTHLPGIHNNIFNKKLQQIRTRIKEVKVDGYSKIRLSVSIGGVMTHNETIESAMHRADKLMLQAKSHQKGMVVTEENEFGVIDNESEVKDRQCVLVVDDSYMNRMILTEMLLSLIHICQIYNSTFHCRSTR